MIKLSGEPNGDAGDAFTGLDRFGRVVDQRWLNSNDINIDRYEYGYDRNSNRVWKFNAINDSRSELYTYDALNQLTTFGRGELNTPRTGLVNTLTTQAWDYDAAGNWEGVTTDGNLQARTHNRQNEIEAIGAFGGIDYDANGNTLNDEGNKEFRYDAWNKLKAIRVNGGVFDALIYTNDALNRRIREEVPFVPDGFTIEGLVQSDVTDRYFSANWQLIVKERTELFDNTSDATPATVTKTSEKYVWSPVYIDCLNLRDRLIMQDDNFLSADRHYALQDANFNVTGLVDMDGNVVQRVAYSPFGVPEFLDAGWNISGNAYNWSILHQGGEQGAAGLYSFRNRVYSPTLGRWMQVDPIGFAGGDVNLYRSYHNGPMYWSDYSGYVPTISVGPASKVSSAWVECFEGKMTPKTDSKQFIKNENKCVEFLEICAFAHEYQHIQFALLIFGKDPCEGKPNGHRVRISAGFISSYDEYSGYMEEAKCLWRAAALGAGGKECKEFLLKNARRAYDKAGEYKRSAERSWDKCDYEEWTFPDHPDIKWNENPFEGVWLPIASPIKPISPMITPDEGPVWRARPNDPSLPSPEPTRRPIESEESFYRRWEEWSWGHGRSPNGTRTPRGSIRPLSPSVPTPRSPWISVRF